MSGFLGAAVLCVYLHVFLEWMFFVTKPSLLEAMSAAERLRVLLITPLPLVALLLGVAALLWLLRWLLPAGAVNGLGRGVVASILACCAFVLIDNFTYTILGVGVVSTAGGARFAYLGLLLVLFVWLYRALPAAPSHPRRRTALAGGLVIASTIGALWQLALSPSPPVVGPERAAAARQLPNIIIVSADGVDAAHVSAYGYERLTTPFLERLGQSALVFENAFPNVNSTAGSLVTLLTGKLPLATGLLLHPDILTGVDAYQHLPGILRRLGYRSIHMSTRVYTDPFEENMQDAFDVANFRERGRGSWTPALPRRLALAYAPALHFLGDLWGRVSERVLHAARIRAMINPLVELETAGWVSDKARVDAVLDFFDRAEGPVFAQLHLMETHIPLVPRRPVFSAGIQPEERRARVMDLYDDVIADFDSDVERIAVHLERTSKLANTVLVVTSDHGWGWSYRRLPLIFHFPGGEPRGRRYANAQLIDVAPTLLDYLGVPIPEWMHGMSLLGPIDPLRPIITVKIRQKREGPFRQVRAVGLTICDRVGWLDLHAKTLGSSPVPGHVRPCGPVLEPSGGTAWARLVDELRVNGYDVSSLDDAEPSSGIPSGRDAKPTEANESWGID